MKMASIDPREQPDTTKKPSILTWTTVCQFLIFIIKIEFVRIAQKDKLAIATGGNRIKVISLTGGTSLFEHSVSEDELTEIASISVIDGKCLVAGWSGLIKVLNLHNFEWIELASENDEAAISSDIDKTLSRAVTGGSEGTVRG